MDQPLEHDVEVLCGDAFDLDSVLPRRWHARIGTAICGIPLVLLPIAEQRRFVRAVIQADAYGISISTVLRTQANEMRIKRRQRAEEAAQKIPVKILMPLMLFVLPVLFLTVLGPTVLTFVAQ